MLSKKLLALKAKISTGEVAKIAEIQKLENMLGGDAAVILRLSAERAVRYGDYHNFYRLGSTYHKLWEFYTKAENDKAREYESSS